MARLRYRPPITKLYPPSTESRLLERSDLVSVLIGLQHRKLAVVTAPTGSGKSTLLAQGFAKLAAGGWETTSASMRARNSALRFETLRRRQCHLLHRRPHPLRSLARCYRADTSIGR